MLYTKATIRAMKIAFDAHRGQADRAGIDYVNHPLHIAEQMDTEAETCAALLHDVIEDTDWTIEQLREEGIPKDALDALTLLTHDDEVPYMDYIEAIKANPIAVKVKLADLAHNSDLTRLPEVSVRDLERVGKYEEARRRLLG